MALKPHISASGAPAAVPPELSSSEAPPQRQARSWIRILLKLAFGLGLLAALLFWNGNGRKMLGHFGNVQGIHVALLIGMALLLNVINSMKWKLFLDERNIRLPATRLFGLYMIGRFFSNFMPSMVGGDVPRILLLGKQIDSHLTAFTSVFLERFTGMVAMIFLAALFTVIHPDLRGEPLIATLVFAVTLALAVFLLCLFSSRLPDWICSRVAHLPLGGRVAPKLKRVFDDLLFFKGRRKLLVRAMVYSVVFNLLTSVNLYIACRAIGFRPAILDIAALNPVILLLNCIPVSPNNIGWWEWTFSVLLRKAGAGAAEGLAVALVLRAATFALSLAGGIIYLFHKNRVSTAAEQPGLARPQ